MSKILFHIAEIKNQTTPIFIVLYTNIIIYDYIAITRFLQYPHFSRLFSKTPYIRIDFFSNSDLFLLYLV